MMFSSSLGRRALLVTSIRENIGWLSVRHQQSLPIASSVFVATGRLDLRYKSTTTSTTTLNDNNTTKPKGRESSSHTDVDLSSLPPPLGPSKLDAIRALMSGAFSDRVYLQNLQKQYGDVVHLWAFQNMYYIFDPEIFMTILRQEWAYPFGAAPNTWPFQIYYRIKSPETMPLMLLQGEEWKTPRHVIQTHMFSPKAADSYQPGINQVVKDASTYLQHHPKPNDLCQFLMNVSFEMLAQVLLDRRMGLLDRNLVKRTGEADEDKFVSSAVYAFHALGEMLIKPNVISNPTILRFFPVWNKLESNMDIVWDIGMKWLEEAEQKKSDLAFFTKLEEQGKMGRQERLVNLITLLQAGVDTTSNSLAWAVVELARRPLLQEQLRQELRNTIADGEGYCRQHKLPYLKAFMREVQRCSPTASGNLRKMPYDVQAGEYVLKKDSLIFWNQEVYGHDPELLGGDADEFIPDRWLAFDLVTNDKDLDPRKPIKVDGFNGVMAPAPILSHPLMTTAFGVGPRMCVGSRIAQNEIHSFLSQICRDYELVLDPPDQTIGRTEKLLTVPDPFPQIRFDPIQK
jgi:cytochrome P450